MGTLDWEATSMEPWKGCSYTLVEVTNELHPGLIHQARADSRLSLLTRPESGHVLLFLTLFSLFRHSSILAPTNVQYTRQFSVIPSLSLPSLPPW